MNQSAIVNRRVLVIDDNPAIHQDFRKILCVDGGDTSMEEDELAIFGESKRAPPRPYFEVDSAFQGQEGVNSVRAALAGRPYAVAIVDMQMPPGMNGLQTIECLWKIDPDLQVLICSAHADYDWTELVVRLGHADKLLVIKKPFEPIEVLQCTNALCRKWQNEWLVRRQVDSLEKAVHERTTSLEAANSQLRYLATHDALTGLPNRALLEDRIGQAIALKERHGRPFAVMLLDLDRFKIINDTMGHRAGDELLKEVGTRLCGVVREMDTVARLGGDEFVIVLLSVSCREEAMLIAERAIAALQAPVRILGVDLQASTSVGIALHPDDGDSISGLLQHADAAMYHAKQSGRGKARCFASGMSTSTAEKMALERDLANAVQAAELELYYQPKVDVVTGDLRGAEALIRWRHPTRGLLQPGQFIPMAEECGLIGSVGEWMVQQACRQARTWLDAGLAPTRIAVNLWPAQFRHGNLLATIRHALDDARLEARYLEVELAESAVMAQPETSVTILEQLSQMGILVSVNDFGTGYSSMSYLRRFPIDKLKIDRGFIADLMSRPDDVSIVRAIVSLAHSLRLKVVAEGVETREQLELLKSLGCDQYQGLCFSGAVTAGDFTALLRQKSARALQDDEGLRTHSKLAAFRR